MRASRSAFEISRRQAELRHVVENALDGQRPVHDVLLRHVADGGPERVELGIEVGAVDEHRAGVRGLEPGQRRQQGRLPGAAAADDRDQLVRPDRDGRDVQDHASAADDPPQAGRVDRDAAGRVDARERAAVPHELRRADLDAVTGSELVLPSSARR